MSTRFPILVALPVACLLAALSAAGLLTDAYARETAAWQAQAIGQDWFDLLVAAPWLAVCAVLARRSYRWRIVLAGTYAYVVYEMVIYAFAVHFNALFLIYCATLGLAAYALVLLALDLARSIPPVDRRNAHLAGGMLTFVGVAFALLWLAEDVPAVLHNEPSRSLTETGLLTNPVHVMDLAFVLPAHILAGYLVWKRRPAGAVLAPIVLAFGVLMAASIGGMLVAMAQTGPVAIAMFATALASAAVLARLLAPGDRDVEARAAGAGVEIDAAAVQ